MDEIYCSECGTKLEYVLDSDDYCTVKPCPNCTHAECYWRSVKDDPPRPNYMVIICWDGIDAVTTSFRFQNSKGEDCWWNGNYRVMPNPPDWWMELPEPPKENE